MTDTIKVPVSTLEKMEARLDKLEDENVLLKKVASKSRLAIHEEKEDKGTSIKVYTYTPDGKSEQLLVTSWGKLLKDHVRYGRGLEQEDQRMKFTLENKEEIEIEYKEFHKVTERVVVMVDPEKTTYNKDKSVKEFVFDWNGKETTISPTFIN